MVGRMKDVCMMKLHETSTVVHESRWTYVELVVFLEIEFAHKNVRDRVLR